MAPSLRMQRIIHTPNLIKYLISPSRQKVTSSFAHLTMFALKEVLKTLFKAASLPQN